MSANNYLYIEKDGEEFIVSELDADTNTGVLLNRSVDLQAAIEWAKQYQVDNIVEYGIHFDNIGTGNKDWQMMEQRKLKGGMLDGITRLWYPNGRLMLAVTYEKGELHGRYRWWDEYGKLGEEDYYIKGRWVSKDEFEQAREGKG